MSYAVREIGVPSTVATGAGADAAALSVAADVAACWPFPQAATHTAKAVTVATRIHGVLKNWLIWSSTQKKSDCGQTADAPGGGSLASTMGSHQFLMVSTHREECCVAAFSSVLQFSRRPVASIRQRLPASIGRQGLDCQRVNIGLQEIRDGCINQLVPGNGR